MNESLRLGIIAPIARAVTRDCEHSIEQLVWLLSEELVRRGYDVTLFATGDSETSARLRSTYARGYVDDRSLWNWQFHETMHVATAFSHAHELDVIHSHNYCLALPFNRLVSTPVVHSYHIMPGHDIARSFADHPEAQIVAISKYQRSFFCHGSRLPVIYHGIDTDAFPFAPERGDYLLFLGRMIPQKGPLEAIRVAQQVGMPLVMAGPGDEYFEAHVAPLVDGRLVEYVGPVAGQERNRLLAGAAALLYPVLSPEPFGLVMVEAMACGTPVAALGLGAIPEILEQAVTGYIADGLESLAACIPHTVALDRARIREQTVERFDYRRMVDEYINVYRSVTAGVGSGAR